LILSVGVNFNGPISIVYRWAKASSTINKKAIKRRNGF